jgi:hypothetical protein
VWAEGFALLVALIGASSVPPTSMNSAGGRSTLRIPRLGGRSEVRGSRGAEKRRLERNVRGRGGRHSSSGLFASGDCAPTARSLRMASVRNPTVAGSGCGARVGLVPDDTCVKRGGEGTVRRDYPHRGTREVGPGVPLSAAPKGGRWKEVEGCDG